MPYNFIRFDNNYADVSSRFFYNETSEGDMQVNIYNKGIYTVAGLSGELDECASAELRRKLDEGLAVPGVQKNILFDMGGVSFMDSTGIGVLLGRYKLLKQRGKNMFICNVNTQMDRILRTTGIYTIMRKVSV